MVPAGFHEGDSRLAPWVTKTSTPPLIADEAGWWPPCSADRHVRQRGGRLRHVLQGHTRAAGQEVAVGHQLEQAAGPSFLWQQLLLALLWCGLPAHPAHGAPRPHSARSSVFLMKCTSVARGVKATALPAGIASREEAPGVKVNR